MYTQEQFQNLQFNPLIKEPMLSSYPKLKEIVEWKPDDIDELIRYVILVYDPKSILVVNEKDLNYRKEVAADLAGLNKKDDVYIQSVYDFTHQVALELTVQYLVRFAKSTQFAAIVAFEYTFWESIRLLLKPIKGDVLSKDREILDAVQKKSAIKNEIDEDIRRIENYYKEFFGHDAGLQEAFKTERFTPEKMAKLRKTA